MEGFGISIAVVLFVVLGVGIWFVSMGMDKDRITAYVQERGGRIVSISWAPFGRGWFGEKNDRIYEVVYYDQAGKQHFATCKTSVWSGVYWTEDRETHHKSGWYDSLAPGNEPGKPVISQIPQDAKEDEAEELRRLREENARLREQLGRCPACGAAVAPGAARCPSCEIALR